MDDASTDRTPDVVMALAARDHRIRGIRNIKNRKLPGSLNAGFANVRGELLTWTSDDNVHRPDAIAELVAFLGSQPSVDIVYSNYTEIDEEGMPIRPMVLPGPECLAFENSVGPCFLYRARVQAQVGGYAEDLFLAEDYDFWLRASCSFRLARIDRDLYQYRVHGGSLTTQRMAAALVAHHQTLWRNLPRMRWLTRTVRAHGYLELARRAARREDLTAVRSLVWAATRQSPSITIGRCSARSVALTCRGTEPASDAESFWALCALGVGGRQGHEFWMRGRQFIRHPCQSIGNRVRRIARWLLQGKRRGNCK